MLHKFLYEFQSPNNFSHNSPQFFILNFFSTKSVSSTSFTKSTKISKFTNFTNLKKCGGEINHRWISAKTPTENFGYQKCSDIKWICGETRVSARPRPCRDHYRKKSAATENNLSNFPAVCIPPGISQLSRPTSDWLLSFMIMHKSWTNTSMPCDYLKILERQLEVERKWERFLLCACPSIPSFLEKHKIYPTYQTFNTVLQYYQNLCLKIRLFTRKDWKQRNSEFTELTSRL